MFEESPRFWIDAKKLNIYILNSFLEERLNPNSGEVLFSFFLHSSMIKSGAHELFWKYGGNIIHDIVKGCKREREKEREDGSCSEWNDVERISNNLYTLLQHK